MIRIASALTIRKRRIFIACGIFLVAGALVALAILGERTRTVDVVVASAAPARIAAGAASPGLPVPVPARSEAATCDEVLQSAKDVQQQMPPSAYGDAQDALVAVAADLASHATPKDHGLGLYAQGLAALAHASSGDQQNCTDDAPCPPAPDPQARDQFLVEQRNAFQPFIRYARSSNDPDFYALAYALCSTTRSDPAMGDNCGMISAARWAQLDPSNALPWLHIAQEADLGKDVATRDEAYFRASRASKIVASGILPAELLQGLRDRPIAPGAQLVIGAMAFESINPAITPPLFPLLSPQPAAYCSSASVREPNRRQVCSDLAQVIVDHADSLALLSAGGLIGQRTGWKRDRLIAVFDRLDAAHEVSAISIAGSTDASRVAACQLLPSAMGAYLRQGEIAEFDRRIAGSGKSIAELAADYRKSAHIERVFAPGQM